MATPALDLDHYERRLRGEGFLRIAGIDEAGRGALAGPLVVAAVILGDGFDLDGVNDSKQLTPRQRERADARIRAEAVAYAVVRAMPRRIDHRGLQRSNLSLFRRAIRALPVPPEYVLADGFPLRGLPIPHLSIKKGDAVTASVAAASIVAKVERDRIMDRYHRGFPDYGFDCNRGYGTRRHWDALVRLGPTPIHRRSFKGVAEPLPLPGREPDGWEPPEWWEEYCASWREARAGRGSPRRRDNGLRQAGGDGEL